MRVKQDRVLASAYSHRKGIIAAISTDDMSNGIGVKTVVYVSGCLFNCYNCFNRVVQNFNYGLQDLGTKGIKGPNYYSKEVEDYIIDTLRPDYVSGLTLLGGEPFMNGNVCIPLCKRVRKEFGDTKTIWSWTGYEWEELLEASKLDFPVAREQRELLSLIDTLVDGRYIDSVRKLDIKRNHGRSPHFRGSSNQRIIDVKKSLCYNDVVEDKELYGDEIVANRVVDFKELTGKESPEELEGLGV